VSGADPQTAASRAHDLLDTTSVVLNGQATSRQAAITEAGQLLVQAGAVEPAYVDAMHEREQSVSTHMGNLLAIPHGTSVAKSNIRRTAISYVHYPKLIDWDGKPTEFVIGIAGAGDDHLKLLSRIAELFTSSDGVERLRASATPTHARATLLGDA